MPVHNIFTTPVIVDHFILDNDTLEQYCRKNIQTHNGSQSEFLDLNAEPMKQLVSLVQNKFDEMNSMFCISDEYYQKIDKAWTNLNNSEPINKPHCHPGCFFSGVYYVSAGENSSEIEFISPNQVLEHVIDPKTVNRYTPYTSGRWGFKPFVGTFIAFPSWLIHFVKVNQKDDRISIAFDTILEKKNASI